MGRHKGVSYGPIKKPRTGIRFKSITLDVNKHLGQQLREYRLFLGLSFNVMGERMGCDPSNVNHYETPSSKNKFNGSLTFTYRYARALGCKEIKLKL